MLLTSQNIIMLFHSPHVYKKAQENLPDCYKRLIYREGIYSVKYCYYGKNIKYVDEKQRFEKYDSKKVNIFYDLIINTGLIENKEFIDDHLLGSSVMYLDLNILIAAYSLVRYGVVTEDNSKVLDLLIYGLLAKYSFNIHGAMVETMCINQSPCIDDLFMFSSLYELLSTRPNELLSYLIKLKNSSRESPFILNLAPTFNYSNDIKLEILTFAIYIVDLIKIKKTYPSRQERVDNLITVIKESYFNNVDTSIAMSIGVDYLLDDSHRKIIKTKGTKTIDDLRSNCYNTAFDIYHLSCVLYIRDLQKHSKYNRRDPILITNDQALVQNYIFLFDSTYYETLLKKHKIAQTLEQLCSLSSQKKENNDEELINVFNKKCMDTLQSFR